MSLPPAHGAAVTVTRAPVTLPTYLPAAPDRNPMFLDKRVYQGSSGRVYPLPFTDRIAEERTDVAWDAVHLENEFIQLMILPQIGGRIHVGRDKTNGYDFFYRQDVIKPALVGLAGPWISGGVEFNWPQHHRPSTFMPADVEIEEHADGSKTVWLSEHEPMNRMKGMHGVCLHPGKAIIELKARVYNRTEVTQTFLWWANVATRVHERYQSFFPPDVTYVADHAKRSMSEFPYCRDHYYGVDYGNRGGADVPAAEQPALFRPPGDYAAHDLSWYANIPVPTSYMAMGSDRDFFGGYDHAAEAGVVHVANHHIAPGKKQWTWGNHEFGYAWDRNLTDPDADGTYPPYIELMAGVYTDNQPDFSFLAPGETKTWSQFWYPIQKIGVPDEANRVAAVSLRPVGEQVRVAVAAAEAIPGARIELQRTADRAVLHTWTRDLRPDAPFITLTARDARGAPALTDLRLIVRDASGHELIAYSPRQHEAGDVPPPATEPPLPADIASADELYVTGLHLEQYRHATRRPEAYWQEALRRDPDDARCNLALGRWHLRRGEFTAAEAHVRRSIARLTLRNPNPSDGEPHYHLGLALRHQGNLTDAYAAFYKATWNQAWQSPAFLALAEIDCRRADWTTALDHLDRALRVNADHLQARNLRVMVLRRLDRAAEAARELDATLALDPLDQGARWLRADSRAAVDPQTRLDLALDFARAGFFRNALDLASDDLACNPGDPRALGTRPLLGYYRGWLYQKIGDTEAARFHFAAAAAAPADHCFPGRLEEIAILETAIATRPADARARHYLGNLLYDRGRRPEAVALWQEAADLDPHFPTVWRNLGLAAFNELRDPVRARDAYERAFAADPTDARLFYERDQLWKRLGEQPAVRLQEFERHAQLVGRRDDLTVELAALFNQTGRPADALTLLNGRHFQPWEGGEGQALGQHVRTHLALGRAALAADDATAARRHFEAALTSPPHLGEAKHLLLNQSDIHYQLGLACAAAGDESAARAAWSKAADFRGDFQDMSVKRFSEMTYYTALALRRLDRAAEAETLLQELLAYADELARTPAKIDYFATSLPTMLVFNEDIQFRQVTTARFLAAQARLGLGQTDAARAALADVLARDPNHALAADLQSSLPAA